MTRVTLAEARDRLPELLDAATSGESVLIAADDGHEFRIVATSGIASLIGTPKAGSCRGLIKIADDFDEPLDELADYMS